MEPAQPSLWPTFVIFGGLFLFMYFMIIRPQNKRNAQIKDMLSKLEKGSEIIAASGILGKVKDISGAYVSLEIGENNNQHSECKVVPKALDITKDRNHPACTFTISTNTS